MNIKDYFLVLWRRKWIVVVTTVAALAAAIVGTQVMTPRYQTSTTLRVAASAGGPLNFTASTYARELINTTAQIASSRTMLDELVTRLQLKERPVITAAVIPETELIRITVEYPAPQEAAQIANTLAEMLIVQSSQLYTGGSAGLPDFLAQQVAQYRADVDQMRKEYDALLASVPAAPEKAAARLYTLQLKERTYEELLLKYNDALLQQEVHSNMITVVEKAIPPSSYVRPRVAYNYTLGFVVGLLMGVVLAFIAESFDATPMELRGRGKRSRPDEPGKNA